MILVVHVLIALLSVGFAGLAYIDPTRGKVIASYAMSASTLVSGMFLVASQSSSILRACIMGTVFVGITLSLTYAANRRYVLLQAKNKN